MNHQRRVETAIPHMLPPKKRLRPNTSARVVNLRLILNEKRIFCLVRKISHRGCVQGVLQIACEQLCKPSGISFAFRKGNLFRGLLTFFQNPHKLVHRGGTLIQRMPLIPDYKWRITGCGDCNIDKLDNDPPHRSRSNISAQKRRCGPYHRRGNLRQKSDCCKQIRACIAQHRRQDKRNHHKRVIDHRKAKDQKLRYIKDTRQGRHAGKLFRGATPSEDHHGNEKPDHASRTAHDNEGIHKAFGNDLSRNDLCKHILRNLI